MMNTKIIYIAALSTFAFIEPKPAKAATLGECVNECSSLACDRKDKSCKDKHNFCNKSCPSHMKRWQKQKDLLDPPCPKLRLLRKAAVEERTVE